MKLNKIWGQKMAYKIYTDSTANLPNDLIGKYGVEVISLNYFCDDVEYTSYVKGNKNDLKPFYDELRTKKKFTTSCINEETFIKVFEEELKNDNDVLYIGFTSGLSVTYNCARMASVELNKKYPNQKVVVVDSLCASMGLGLLVVEACKLKETGLGIDEVCAKCEEIKHKVSHLFTVEDLFYLYRGGRLSATSYHLANVLHIKPTLRVDEEGKLTAYGKVMGRKKSLNALVDKLCQTIVNPEEQEIFIAHADCVEDAETVKELISKKISVKGFVVNYIDAVIGSHAGPGTLAIFYFANDRSVK